MKLGNEAKLLCEEPKCHHVKHVLAACLNVRVDMFYKRKTACVQTCRDKQYVCMYVRTHAHICVCMYLCMFHCLRVSMHSCMHVCTVA